jgi:hypothetical protein
LRTGPGEEQRGADAGRQRRGQGALQGDGQRGEATALYAARAVIAFATSITDPEAYERCAGPGLRLAAEPDSVLLPTAAAGSIFRSYNLILDRAAALEDLEALVIVHQDAEIVDPAFAATVRRALQDPDVGVVGAAGAIGVRSIAWWEGSTTWASFTHRYGELGGGEIQAFAWGHEPLPAYAHTGEVDTVDGFVLCLSPWVVRNVRFDESLGQLHGYDLDFCLQVREVGRKVVTADLKVVHHHSLDLVSNPDTWIAAHIAIADKWEGRMPGIGTGGGDWKARARYAEAAAEATHAVLRSTQLKYDARERQLLRDQQVMETSIGWRITHPLRRLNHLRRQMARRRVNAP